MANDLYFRPTAGKTIAYLCVNGRGWHYMQRTWFENNQSVATILHADITASGHLSAGQFAVDLVFLPALPLNIGVGTRDTGKVVQAYTIAGVLRPGTDTKRLEAAHEDWFKLLVSGVNLYIARHIQLDQVFIILSVLVFLWGMRKA